MSRSLRHIATAAAATLAVGAWPRPASAHHVALLARMSPAEVVPVPGPPAATGAASVDLSERGERICYRLTYTGIGALTLAGIHRGARGETGPLVVDLGVRERGNDGCLEAEPAVVRAIHDDPGAFHVSFHTAAYPGGAVRGQLQPVG